MKEEKHTAIMLKATDYSENDKLVRLLTITGGVITAKMRGVKNAKAKLKFGAQPFAFCEYVLASGKGYKTVIACSPCGDLYPICHDPNKYMAGCLILEATDIAALGNSGEGLFLMLLQTLKALAYTAANPNLICAQYLLKLTDALGYGTSYIYDGDLSPKNLRGVFAAVSALPPDGLEGLDISGELCLRAAKMQAGLLGGKLDIEFKSVRFLNA